MISIRQVIQFIAAFILVTGCSITPSQPPSDPMAVLARFSLAGQKIAPARILFSNYSINGREFYWDFGNGRTFDGKTPGGVTYYNSGTYNVTLIAADSTTDRADTLTQEIVITPGGPYLDTLRLHAIWPEKRIGVPWDADSSGPDFLIRIYTAAGSQIRYSSNQRDFPLYYETSLQALPLTWGWGNLLPEVPGLFRLQVLDYDAATFTVDTMTTFLFAIPELEGEVADTLWQSVINQRRDGTFAEVELVWHWI